MNTNKKTARIMEDVKINVKIKLSVLWVALLFLYLYNDVLSLFRADMIEEIIAGELPIGSQISFVGFAILMAIPIVMVFLSLTLKAKVNRWVNIILGIFHAGILLASLLAPGEIWAYSALYMISEAVFIALIVGHAWKWPKQEA